MADDKDPRDPADPKVLPFKKPDPRDLIKGFLASLKGQGGPIPEEAEFSFIDLAEQHLDCLLKIQHYCEHVGSAPEQAERKDLAERIQDQILEVLADIVNEMTLSEEDPQDGG